MERNSGGFRGRLKEVLKTGITHIESMVNPVSGWPQSEPMNPVSNSDHSTASGKPGDTVVRMADLREQYPSSNEATV